VLHTTVPDLGERLITEHGGDLIESRLAVFDQTHAYRYLLERHWGDAPAAVFVMLNPSTADAHTDDPTIHRCIGFARREGCGALIVVNLFALRTTDPYALAAHRDPIGPDNDQILHDAVNRDALVIAAWGAHGTLLGRGAAVARLLEAARPQCLGLTAHGHPRHPLYLPATAPLAPFTPDREVT
jgi:hypothetical protein